MDRWLHRNFYWYGREWIYRDLAPRLIAERFLKDAAGQPPPDFKFFCFEGEPRLVQVDADRFRHHSRSFYSPEWRLQPATMTYPPIAAPVAPPARLEEMLRICRRLSEGLPFVRVDLYDCPERVVFGEMTFLRGRGLEPFDQKEYEAMVGDWIRLPAAVPDSAFAPRLRAALR